jgi:hypothetical protein
MLVITRPNETGHNSTHSTVTIEANVDDEHVEQEIRPSMNTIQQEAATVDWLLSRSSISIDDNTNVQRDNTKNSDNTRPYYTLTVLGQHGT